MKCAQSAPLIRMSGQHGGDQLARRVFVEKRDRVHGCKRGGEFGALIFGNQRAGGTLQALDAGVGV